MSGPVTNFKLTVYISCNKIFMPFLITTRMKTHCTVLIHAKIWAAKLLRTNERVSIRWLSDREAGKLTFHATSELERELAQNITNAFLKHVARGIEADFALPQFSLVVHGVVEDAPQ